MLLRQYVNLMDAKVCGPLFGSDFNQITEILMAADLSRMPKDRLSFFIDVDHESVYQHFSWYRGEVKRSTAGTLTRSNLRWC